MLNKIALAILLSILVAILLVALKIGSFAGTREKLDALDYALERAFENSMGTVMIKWASGGQNVEFSSSRVFGESIAEWSLRARSEYRALRLAFSPDVAPEANQENK